MNMDGDDAQLVDSILREYGSQPQQLPPPMNTTMPSMPPSMGFDTDPNIGSTPVQQNIPVSYNQSNLLWQNLKLPLVVLVICYLVFNPFIYYYLLKLAPAIFGANTAVKMQLRVFILSLIVALLFSLVVKYV
jgi:hypothetical protein